VVLFVEPGDPALPAHVNGSVTNPRRWFYFAEEGGTTSELFAEATDQVLSDLEQSNLEIDNDRTLTWDNLGSHLTDLVSQTVYNRLTQNLFRYVARPPYMPKYGATEYVFAELSAKLKERVQPHWTFAILRQEVTNILSEIGRNGSFEALFRHCLGVM